MAHKFYLTTPIYYVNARPHIGHAYTTIVADVLARRHRLSGDDTWFLTGTDEHGQKIERSALAAGVPPQQFTDQVSKSFRDLWDRMGLTYDQYIRTTDETHKRGVQKLFTTLQEKGAIYLDSYTGAYCVSDEAFVDVPVGTPCPDCGRITETVTEENYFFKLSEYQLPLLNLIESNELTIEPEARRNEVLSFLRGPVTETEKNAVILSEAKDLSISSEHPQTPTLAYSAKGTPYVPGSLRDLSISRSSFTWGIPVPKPTPTLGAPGLASETWEGAEQIPAQDHVIYVWLDALANYMTAVGYGDDTPEGQAKFAKYWPADLHIVGKEIIRFHCVYWPAFLLAAGIDLPKKVVAHGWLLFDDSKMSKSKGNIVRTETILDVFGALCPQPTLLSFRSEAEESAFRTAAANASLKGTASAVPSPAADTAALAAEGISTHHRDLFAADVLRYFLLREIPFGQDGSFSFDALITRYNADLANGYGNLVSRTLSMIAKYRFGVVPTPSEEESEEVHQEIANLVQIGSRYIRYVVPNLKTHSDEMFEGLEFSREIGRISTSIASVDSYLSSRVPWKLATATDDVSQRFLSRILYVTAESIRIITALLYPILPYATAQVWIQLGLGGIELAAKNGDLKNLQWGGLKPGTKLGPLSPIFPRADKGLAQIMADMELQKDPTPSKLVDESFAQAPTPVDPTHPGAPPRTGSFTEPSPGLHVAGSGAMTTERAGTPSHTEAASGIFSGQAESPQITIDDFAKIDLRVAKILVAERIPKADKLLRLEVDLGYEQRQILSGIAEYYTPEELIGKRIVVITNLAPRKMRGLESHGMLLAASAEGGKPILATFPESEELPLGSRLK